jgi:hypothetical protein
MPTSGQGGARSGGLRGLLPLRPRLLLPRADVFRLRPLRSGDPRCGTSRVLPSTPRTRVSIRADLFLPRIVRAPNAPDLSTIAPASVCGHASPTSPNTVVVRVAVSGDRFEDGKRRQRACWSADDVGCIVFTRGACLPLVLSPALRAVRAVVFGVTTRPASTSSRLRSVSASSLASSSARMTGTTSPNSASSARSDVVAVALCARRRRRELDQRPRRRVCELAGSFWRAPCGFTVPGFGWSRERPVRPGARKVWALRGHVRVRWA